MAVKNKIEYWRLVHKMTSLAIEEAIDKGEGPIEVLEWAMEYGKSFDLKKEDIALYLLTTPEKYVQEIRRFFPFESKEVENADSSRTDV